MLFGTTDQGQVDITIDVFTDGENWSRATKSQTDGSPRVIDFKFPVVDENDNVLDPGDFSPQGQNLTQGADFATVGAVVLTLEVSTAAVDVPFGSPLVLGCGTDFGDAPTGNAETVTFQGNTFIVGGQSYRTLAEGFSDEVCEGTLCGPNPDDPEGRDLRGPHHAIGGPFLGLGNNDTDSEPDGQPSANADGDQGDEQALQTPPVFYADFVVQGDVNPLPANPEFAECAGVTMGPNEYCVALEASNPTDQWAQVVGWIDFRGSGSFDNLCSGSTSGVVEYEDLDNLTGDFCERSAATIRVGNLNGNGLRDAGQSPPESCQHTELQVGEELNEGIDWSTGNIPPGCEGIVVLTWNLDDVVQAEIDANSEDGAILTTDATFARFRITTDTFVDTTDDSGFFSESGPTPFGYAADGEVEDHRIVPDTLPVSISSFESRYTRGGLEVSWTTVSETENIGFYIWGDRGDGLDLLTEEMIPSTADDIAHPQEYSVTIPGIRHGSIDDLAITAIDNRGREEMYGIYQAGESFGRKGVAEPVDWLSVRDATERRLAELGVEERANGLLAHTRVGAVRAVDLAATEVGMQEVSYEDLAAAGLDLHGVPVEDLAVTLKGQAVPRQVVIPERRNDAMNRTGSEGRFGPGGVIRFWGAKPDFPDALYIEDYVYRIEVDPARAAAPREVRAARDSRPMDVSMHTVTVSDAVGYNPVNPNPDPFFTKRLRANSGNDTYTAALEVSRDARLDLPAIVEVRVGGETRLPANPDHHVRVKVNGEVVTDDYFNGVTSHVARAEIPGSLLQHGANEITVSAPGETNAQYDFMLLNTVTLHYARTSIAQNDAALIEGADAADSVGARGFLGTDLVGFAWDGELLWSLEAQPVGRGGGMAPTIRNHDEASYWISTGDAFRQPEFVRAVGPNELLDVSRETDLVVIAHPAFMPASPGEFHPLNTWLDHRQSQGWNPQVFDILEIQNQYGGGMPLPMAVNAFLRDASRHLKFDHVLLVGEGTYDHLDRLGLGSISFIPSPYRATSRIRHTPSDAHMADVTGDGLNDKAIGRWPARTLDDLYAIVTKTMDWENNTRHQQGAVWLTGAQDPTVANFGNQIQRMVSPLADAGWSEDSLNLVVFEEAGGADNVRAQFINALEEGRALSGFSGHAAPNMWSFDGVFAPSDVSLIDNIGLPTMIGTLSCYTSYAVSPYGNSIAHRMMNGYMLDSSGDQIPGAANGAAAIHGAATLSNLAQNEIMARTVLELQLEGLTLGEAIRQARSDINARGMRDQAINWTLLGDPTLRLVDQATAGRR